MKIKTYLFVCIIISHFSLLNAQNVGINDDGSTPNSNAILDIKTSSNDKGVLLPRLTSSQRTSFGSSLAASEQSMMVYDTDTKSYWYWNGTVWNEFLQNQSGWKINGNSGTNSASNFIGTTDAQDLILKSNNVVGLQIDNSSGYVGIGHNFNFGILAQLHIRTQGSTDATYAFGFQSGLGYVYYITDAGTVFHTGNYNLTGRFIQNGGLSRKAENTFSYIRHNTQSVPDTSEAGLAISWNRSGGNAEIDLWNCYAKDPFATRGFVFRQMLSDNTPDSMLMINGKPNSVRVVKYLMVGNPTTIGTNQGDLTAEGIIRANSFIASTVGSGAYKYNSTQNMNVPDYVFDKYYNGYSKENAEYKNLSLKEVEDYIKKNHHLPRVPSREELLNDGAMNMQAIQMLNLEKIEELYLYVIEQQKRINELEKQLKKLKE